MGRLRWCGHVIRADDNSLAKVGLSIETRRSKDDLICCMVSWELLDITSTEPMSEKKDRFDLDEPGPLLNGAKSKEEEELMFRRGLWSNIVVR